jgi:hypothetical protein
VISLRDVFQAVLSAFDRLEIPFLISGSVASSFHGIPRNTNDIDIVADIQRNQLPAFFEVLGPDFLADPIAAADAIDHGRAFNLIHSKAALKFDIFPVGQDAFGHSELRRRHFAVTTIPGLEHIEFPVASPEDSILSKLVWYRTTGDTSDRQWRDILSVLSIQKNRLDRGYLDEWAAKLGVSDLLLKASQ